MPSNVPQFANVRFQRLLNRDDPKGIQPLLVVTEELNCWIVWRVTSQCEVLLLKHFRGVGARDATIEYAAKCLI